MRSAAARAWTYSPAARWAEASLRAVACATALATAGRVAPGLLGAGPQVSTLEIAVGMAAGALLPWAAAVALRRSRRVQLSLDEARLLLQGRGGPVEFPRGQLSAPRAWRLPLPGPGFRLPLEGGGHLDLLLPPAAARALGAEGTGPLERFALARPARSPWLAAFKFGAFPLLPALVAFRAYQVIGYGGFLGEWHLYGPGRWAHGLFQHWAGTLAVMATWAAVWRAAAEAASLLGAFAGPRAAVNARRGAEIAAGLAYYLAVPAVLAVLFLR